MPHHQANAPSDVVSRLRRLRLERRHARSMPGKMPVPDPIDGVGPGDFGAGDGSSPLTTLEATIRPVGSGRYRRLGWAPGEPHLLRTDLGAVPSPDRARQRRSILYVAHHTDTHVCDAQSPARLEGGETFGWVNPGSDGGHRPQEVCTVHVLDQMVRATNSVATSPITGARMAWCIQTGDNTDNRTTAEVDWWLGVLDGRPVTPNTGDAGRYEGVQRSGWRGVWHPDDPRSDIYGRVGFPRLPGFLDSAVAPLEPAGLDVPWLAVFGNHDAVFQGTFGPAPGIRIDRLGPMLAGTWAKPTGTLGLVRAIVHASLFGEDTARWERWALRAGFGIRSVTADPDERAPVDTAGFLAAMAAELSPSGPGPSGHGFGAADISDLTTWWSRPEGDHVQVIGLDSCNHTTGDGGSIGPRQAAWLEGELIRHHRRWRDRTGAWVHGDGRDRLVVLASHHNSWTMDNGHDDAADPGPRLMGADLVELLHRFPNVVLWANGHCHEHRIIAHRGETPVDGFWEVDTASCIDFAQQGRTFEVVDNRDGTVSVLVTVLDHAAPPQVPHRRGRGWTTAELASISRELAANDSRWIDPIELLGTPLDRNVELVAAAPFDLS